MSDADIEKAVRGIEGFRGTHRRFEQKGYCNGAVVIDDYAHHPTEIKATLSASQNVPHNKLWCIFQPHTYTRTAALCDDFAKALSLADDVILADIYAAREKNTIGIDSSAIGNGVANSKCISGFENIVKELSSVVKPGDFVLTMGAGDIYKVGEMNCNKK